MSTSLAVPSVGGRWTATERLRLTGIVGVIVALHVVGWSIHLYYSASLRTAGTFAGAGTLAYALGIRHAFDADHIAAIDDTTRLMLQRGGRRPLGVGFFFSLGHSTVVLILALVVAAAAGATAQTGVEHFREIGGMISQLVAMSFLLLVAVLNGLVLVGVVGLWRRLARGEVDDHEVDLQLVNHGLLNRLLGSRAARVDPLVVAHVPRRHPVRAGSGDRQRGHPAGALGERRVGGRAPAAGGAVAAAAVRGGDECLRHRRQPADVTGLLVGLQPAGPAALLHHGLDGHDRRRGRLHRQRVPGRPGRRAASSRGAVASYAELANHFELLGYLVVAAFVLAWAAAALVWRYGRVEARMDARQASGPPGAPC